MFQPVHRRLFRSRLEMLARRLNDYRPWLETLEDRLAPTVTLSISNPTPFPKPDTGQLMGMFVVTRSGDQAPVVLVDYHTQDGTAHAGTDYVATSGTLDFASGQTMATITVPIIGNNVFQADKTFTVNLSNPRPNAVDFAPQQNFTTGVSAGSVAVADFNGDGKLDLATSNGTDPGSVSVLLNTTPTGSTIPRFAPQWTVATDKNPSQVAVGDFNGDDKPDLVVGDYSDSAVSVLLNTTAPGATIPSFAPQQTFAVGSRPRAIVVGDFNGNGKPDIAVTSGNSVSVLLNTTPTGSTTLSFAPQQTFAVGSPISIAVGDFNGDGKPDLVVANQSLGWPGSVSVLLNTTPRGATTPSFAPQQTFPAGTEPFSVAVGDFNGDGKPDIAVANVHSNAVLTLINTTSPGTTTLSFAPPQTFAVGNNPEAVAVGDFIGDGKPDLAVSNSGDGTVSVLLNTTPTGSTSLSFAPQQTFATGGQPRFVAVGDFNGDGKPDLAIAGVPAQAVGVLLNITVSVAITSSTATGTISSASEAPTAIAVGAGTTPQATIVNTAFAVPLAVDIRDAAGHLVQGANVTFTAPGIGSSGKFGSSTSVAVATNASGRATAPTFVANAIAGSYSVTAQASGGSNPTTSFSLTNTPGAPAVLTPTAGSNQDATVNTAFATNLLATITDQYGNRLSGVTITFTGPSSGASAIFMSGTTGTSDTNGQVSKIIMANTVAGTYSIKATANGGSNPTATFINLANIAGPTAVLIATAGSIQSATVNTAFATRLTATVTDQYGNRLAGVPVTFGAPGTGPSAAFPAGNSGTSDANGQVSKPITANTLAGTFSITALASGGSYPTTTFINLTNTAAAPAYFTGTEGGNQSTTVTTAFVGLLLTTVIDQYGNPVPGVTVTYSAPGSGASATFTGANTGTTNGNGLVIKGITANTVAGSYSITATAAGGSDPTTRFVNLTNTPAAPDHFLIATSVNSTVAGTSFDVSVTVQDQFNNTVTGYTGTVHFSSADPYGATLPADYTFTAADQGAHTFAGRAVLYTAGTWDVTATEIASGITGSANVEVTPAPAAAFQVIAPASAASGTPFDVTLIAVDPYGNTDTNYQGTVTWTTTDPDPAVMLPPDYTFQPGDAGQVTFPGGVTLITQGDQTITAADTDSGINGMATVTVIPGGSPSQDRGRPGVGTLVMVVPEQPAASAPPATPSAPTIRGMATIGSAGEKPVERNQVPGTAPRADRPPVVLRARTLDRADLSVWDEVFARLDWAEER